MNARSHRSLATSLLGLIVVVSGCDGRYVIGSAQNATGGTSSAGNGGAMASVGANGGSGDDANQGGAAGANEGGAPLGAGGAGDSNGGSSFSGAGAGGEGETEPNPLGRVRWLLVQTFPSSASSQTLLHLVDLQKPTWEGVTVESTSAGNILPSADGRWVLYYSFRKSETLGNVWDAYVVNMAGKQPGARQLLLADQSNVRGGCVWSPDSTRLACSKRRADAESNALELVLFGVSETAIGPEVDVGPASSAPTFFGPASVVYDNEQSELVRLDLSVDAPATPTGLGLTSQSLVAAPDGRRALSAVLEEPASYTLVDVSNAEKEPLTLPKGFEISPSYDAAVAWIPSSSDDSTVVAGTYYYYVVNGVSASLVGQTDVTYPFAFSTRADIAGRTVAHLSGARVVVAHVAATGPATAREVPGEYASVRAFALDPSGQRLYFETSELDAGVPVVASTKHWVSRVTPAGAEPPQLVAEGFVTGSFSFAPNGKWLLLSGNTYYEKEPQDAPFHLIDLSQPDAPRDTSLPVQLSWATTTFSRDSTYLALIGGSAGRNVRELSVLDLLDAGAQPRVLYSCSANPAPLPGCPNYVLF